MKKFHLPFWKDAPFIRVVLPFIAGIAGSYYANVQTIVLIVCVAFSAAALVIFSKIKTQWQYSYNYVRGILFNLLNCFFRRSRRE